MNGVSLTAGRNKLVSRCVSGRIRTATEMLDAAMTCSSTSLGQVHYCLTVGAGSKAGDDRRGSMLFVVLAVDRRRCRAKQAGLLLSNGRSTSQSYFKPADIQSRQYMVVVSLCRRDLDDDFIEVAFELTALTDRVADEYRRDFSN